MATRNMTLPAKRARTQWAAQFLAASELVRRGYTVSFTMGNLTPDADMMVGAPSGRQFWVDVKGLSSRSSWLIRRKKERLNLYFILVYVASPHGGRCEDIRQGDRFFVLSQSEANGLIRRFRRERPNNKGRMQGFNWTHPHGFENDWAKLPH